MVGVLPITFRPMTLGPLPLISLVDRANKKRSSHRFHDDIRSSVIKGGRFRVILSGVPIRNELTSGSKCCVVSELPMSLP